MQSFEFRRAVLCASQESVQSAREKSESRRQVGVLPVHTTIVSSDLPADMRRGAINQFYDQVMQDAEGRRLDIWPSDEELCPESGILVRMVHVAFRTSEPISRPVYYGFKSERLG